MERPAQGIESRGLARVGDRLRRGHSAELRRLRNSDDAVVTFAIGAVVYFVAMIASLKSENVEK